MPSGKKDQDLQGINQISNIRRQNIVDFEIIASKLNSSVAGNSVRLNTVTNAIDVIGPIVVENSAELGAALASGNISIRLLDGTYSLSQITVSSGTLHLLGSSETSTILLLPPSGTISVNHASGLILTGNASIDVGVNPGVAHVSGMTTGQMPQFSWIGSQLVIDDVPYRVNRVVSGELSGIAQIELVDPYTSSSFIGKPFKLMYMIEGFVLSDMTVVSASNSGIIDVRRAKYALIENVTVKGANVLSRVTSGLKMREVYFSIINNVDVWNTKWTSALLSDRYAYDLDSVYYSAIENCNIVNCVSNGFLINDTRNTVIDNVSFANLTGTAFRLTGSTTRAIITNNSVTAGVDGFVMTSTVSGCVIDNNIINVPGYSFNVSGTANFILSLNTIVNGTILIAAGNILDIIPVGSGVANIGSAQFPFQNLYLGTHVLSTDSQNLLFDNKPVAKVYVHTQTSGSTIWNVNHNMNSQNYTYSLFDNGGGWFMPDNITASGNNNIIVSLSDPIAGTGVFVF